jgi:hypothetical protein
LKISSSLIRYYCVAHRERSNDRSPVTIYQGSWAYCPYGYGPGHEWLAIKPVSDVDLVRFGPTLIRAAKPKLAPA